MSTRPGSRSCLGRTCGAEPDAIVGSELADGPPGPWAAKRWFFDETEAGKRVLAARRAMKAAEAPFPIWFYMAPATRS